MSMRNVKVARGGDVHMTQSGALTVNEVPTGALALSPEGDIGAIRKIQPAQGFGYWSYTGNAYPDGAPIADSR
ncbi:Uncharacterised protein [Mycobacteroides abscessus subsp. abscessus]|nr:Uncharacterised protein [Mycobacteroides abscessus subsp. abscessus]SIC88365.1 Uncharacterised protein [Mycobacteroides abscessus subsp. abscessus]SID08784.1 Uncharacterised protein [Mycobacteroides abscessus subsp. abscessus]SID41758.1 Uncharacterised protein [Mycobacteroides abscessus subsp. abscessus]SKT66486.1 Uncharacterised protein [Mycobacteroides abscessus subsp. abscessus]